MAILIVATIVFLIIIYILCAPVSLSIELPFARASSRAVKIAIFPFSFSLSRKPMDDAGKKKTAKAKKPGARVKKKKTPGSAGRFFLLILNEFDIFIELFLSLLAFVSGLLKSSKHLKLHVSLRGDFGDPCTSGMIYGWSMALIPLLGNPALITYRPDFMGRPLRGEIIGGFEFRIGNVLKELLIFIWVLPKLRMLKVFWRLKKGARRVK